MRTRTAILIAALAATPAAAFGPDLAPIIRAEDRIRLEHVDTVAGRTLRGALAQGTPDDLAVLMQGLAGRPLPADQAAALLPGDWSCRMLKLGGGLPLVVYQPFRCRIDTDGGFVKLTGSQRMQGMIGDLDGAQAYLGTGYIAGDTAPPYADLPDSIDPAATPQRVPEVGMVEVVSPTQARILMPLPMLESDLNILLLTR